MKLGAEMFRGKVAKKNGSQVNPQPEQIGRAIQLRPGPSLNGGILVQRGFWRILVFPMLDYGVSSARHPIRVRAMLC